MTSKLQRKLLKIKKRLDGKTLRMPKTFSQKRDRGNWERVTSILNKRYDAT